MTNWRRILRQLEVGGDGVPYPATESALTTFEKRTGLRLPNSYRSYCRVFGPGLIGHTFRIAVPGYKGSVSFVSVDQLTDTVVHHTEYKIYAPESAEQVRRGLFFGADEARTYYFFDAEDVPYRKTYECAVYALGGDYVVSRLADSFREFVTQYCLGKKYTKLFPGSALELTFVPCSV
jgi:hypothetical protein